MFIECVAAVAYRRLVLMFHFVQNEPIVMEREVTCFLPFVRHSCPHVKKLKSRLRLYFMQHNIYFAPKRHF